MQDDRGFSALPLPPPPGGTAEGRARLEGLAGKRQMLLVAGLVNGIGGIMVKAGGLPRSVDPLVSLAALAIAVFLIVAAVRVAYQLYNVWAAIGSAVAMLIPVVWVVVVVFLVVKSTRRLKAAAFPERARWTPRPFLTGASSRRDGHRQRMEVTRSCCCMYLAISSIGL